MEVELTKKAKTRLLNIIKDNFMEYDVQMWIVPDSQPAILQTLTDSQRYYTNIQIHSLQHITDNVNKEMYKILNLVMYIFVHC